jgi:hypothetical protein
MIVTVLTSGVALGVHVPGLLLARRLHEAGAHAQVEVLERLLAPEARRRIPASKTAFHRDFRTALAGQRLARDMSPVLDDTRVAALFDRWWADDRRRFVALSGFWIPVLDHYAERARVELDVDLCHVDSVPSPSFERCRPRAGGTARYRDVWLLDAERSEVSLTIPVTPAPPVPWRRRPARYLAHGGGWGMGTYAERARALATWGLDIDVVAYESSDLATSRRPGRCFMLDPGWHPWDDDGFPPFGQVAADGSVLFRRSPDHHGSFDLARHARAIVSKPGGGTLMDSLAAATPVVLLEPFGPHEARNAELWQRLGFGLAYDDWWRSGCSAAPLEDLHRNLLAARAEVPSYAEMLA